MTKYFSRWDYTFTQRWDLGRNIIIVCRPVRFPKPRWEPVDPLQALGWETLWSEFSFKISQSLQIISTCSEPVVAKICGCLIRAKKILKSCWQWTASNQIGNWSRILVVQIKDDKKTANKTSSYSIHEKLEKWRVKADQWGFDFHSKCWIVTSDWKQSIFPSVILRIIQTEINEGLQTKLYLWIGKSSYLQLTSHPVMVDIKQLVFTDL